MKRSRWIQLIGAGWWAAGTLFGWAADETVDPRSPAVWHAQEKLLNPSNSRWPWIRIQQLEAEEKILLKKISELPQHNPKFLSSHLGYHSKIQDMESDEPRLPHQINLILSRANPLDSIALAPAFSLVKNGAYAFPKRFKIEVKNSRTGQFETLINWVECKANCPQLKKEIPHTKMNIFLDYFGLSVVFVATTR